MLHLQVSITWGVWVRNSRNPRLKHPKSCGEAPRLQFSEIIGGFLYDLVPICSHWVFRTKHSADLNSIVQRALRSWRLASMNLFGGKRLCIESFLRTTWMFHDVPVLWQEYIYIYCILYILHIHYIYYIEPSDSLQLGYVERQVANQAASRCPKKIARWRSFDRASMPGYA